MQSVTAIQPVLAFIVRAAIHASGWTGWSEFYRSF